MKSKQEMAKINQSYRKQPMQCSNCKNFEYEIEKNEFGFGKQKKLRCGIGGFKIMRSAVCGLWEAQK